MIGEELDISLIFTKLDVKNSEEVMQHMGGVLIQEGYAKDTYIKALIEREKEFPTGLDVGGVGVAIPHTDISHVNKPAVAIAVLENPVTFIQMGSDDDQIAVQLIFMLAVVNPSEHLGRLQRILEIIQDTNVLKKLMNVQEKQEIINIINEKEKTL